MWRLYLWRLTIQSWFLSIRRKLKLLLRLPLAESEETIGDQIRRELGRPELTDEEIQASWEAYDAWKDSYRDAFANYEKACDANDWVEADKQWKLFVELFTPRLEYHGLTDISQVVTPWHQQP
jgi:hypothetical protein